MVSPFCRLQIISSLPCRCLTSRSMPSSVASRSSCGVMRRYTVPGCGGCWYCSSEAVWFCRLHSATVSEEVLWGSEEVVEEEEEVGEAEPEEAMAGTGRGTDSIYKTQENCLFRDLSSFSPSILPSFVSFSINPSLPSLVAHSKFGTDEI